MKTLTREQALQRLEHDENLFNIIHKNDFRHRELSENRHKTGEIAKFSTEIRRATVVLAAEVGTKAAAEIVGTSPQTVSDWKRGVTSHSGAAHNTESGRLKEEVVNTTRQLITENAAEKVLKTLGLISDDKLEACNAVELATVAARLNTITNPKDIGNMGGNKVQVNVYTPRAREESHFESLEVVTQ